MRLIGDECVCVWIYIVRVCKGEDGVIFSGEKLVLRDLPIFQLRKSTDIYQNIANLCLETGGD